MTTGCSPYGVASRNALHPTVDLVLLLLLLCLFRSARVSPRWTPGSSLRLRVPPRLLRGSVSAALVVGTLGGALAAPVLRAQESKPRLLHLGVTDIPTGGVIGIAATLLSIPAHTDSLQGGASGLALGVPFMDARHIRGLGVGVVGIGAERWSGLGVGGFVWAERWDGVGVASYLVRAGEARGVFAGGGASFGRLYGIGIGGVGLEVGQAYGLCASVYDVRAASSVWGGVAGLYVMAPRVLGLAAAGVHNVGELDGISVGALQARSQRLRGLSVGFDVRVGEGWGGIVGASIRLSEGGAFTGAMVGAITQARGQHTGLAIGLVNVASRLRGVQIGLLNYAGNNPPGLRWLPLVNAHF